MSNSNRQFNSTGRTTVSFGQFLVGMSAQAAIIWTGMEALKRPNGSHAAG